MEGKNSTIKNYMLMISAPPLGILVTGFVYFIIHFDIIICPQIIYLY